MEDETNKKICDILHRKYLNSHTWSKHFNYMINKINLHIIIVKLNYDIKFFK